MPHDVDVRRLTSPPAHFDPILLEIGQGLGRLYGRRAEEEYTRGAQHHFRISLANPLVHAFGLFVDGRIGGIAAAVHRQDVVRIGLCHVAREWSGAGLENQFIPPILAHLHKLSPAGVWVEFMPFTPFDGTSFTVHGFRQAERAMMFCASDTLASCHPGSASTAWEASDLAEMADVLVATYVHHDGQWLHPETHGAAAAREFILTAAQGGFGEVIPGSIRVVRRDGRIVAVALGAKAAAETGFVLHVAVAPSHQGNAYGTALLADVGRAFLEAGYPRVGLGVTADNPARRLYQRLGFTEHARMQAYVGRPGPGETWSPFTSHVP